MDKQIEWAEDYVKRYETMLDRMGTAGTESIGGGTALELYSLAKAIVADSKNKDIT